MDGTMWSWGDPTPKRSLYQKVADAGLAYWDRFGACPRVAYVNAPDFNAELAGEHDEGEELVMTIPFGLDLEFPIRPDPNVPRNACYIPLPEEK